ncbi:MAG: ribosome biogenesis GTPase Der [Holosporales bacterium]|jgi:GTP-binding protein|nr:ribosome biogenesis GTPase Der [Holosporales bacterium]
MVACKPTDEDRRLSGIALVGRTNVGKSTLFNRLIGRRKALVHDQPGVTRDCQEGLLSPCDREIPVWDTAGLEPGAGSLEAALRAQTHYALQQVRSLFFLVDAQQGPLPGDVFVAEWLRKHMTPTQSVHLIANKAEHLSQTKIAVLTAEFFALGFGEPLFLSAEHNIGISTLYALAQDALQENPPVEGPAQTPVRVVILGRPNVGKSTLINTLLGESRLLAGPEEGLTRDAIPVSWVHAGHPFSLIDTAGQRRNARVTADLERLAVLRARQAMHQADVACLLLDATRPAEKQDLVIGRRVLEKGVPLILALNKWDQVHHAEATKKAIQEAVCRGLAQDVPAIPISAQKGQHLDELFDRCLKFSHQAQQTFATARLNRWLQQVLVQQPPPSHEGKPTRFKYMTQVGHHPPSFLILGTRMKAIPDTYQRYLVRCFKERFHLSGIPVKIAFRQAHNPYSPAQDS